MTINGVMVAFNIFFVVFCVQVFVVVVSFSSRFIPFSMCRCIWCLRSCLNGWSGHGSGTGSILNRLQNGWYILRFLSFGRCWFSIGAATTVTISTLSHSSIPPLSGWFNDGDAYGLIYWDYWFVFVRSHCIHAHTHTQHAGQTFRRAFVRTAGKQLCIINTTLLLL